LELIKKVESPELRNLSRVEVLKTVAIRMGCLMKGKKDNLVVGEITDCCTVNFNHHVLEG
jgi:hypothetical protein